MKISCLFLFWMFAATSPIEFNEFHGHIRSRSDGHTTPARDATAPRDIRRRVLQPSNSSDPSSSPGRPTASPSGGGPAMPPSPVPSTPGEQPSMNPTDLSSPSTQPMTPFPSTTTTTATPSYSPSNQPSVPVTSKPTFPPIKNTPPPTSKPTKAPTKKPTQKPTNKPCKISGVVFANGIAKAKVRKGTFGGHTTTNDELKSQRKNAAYNNGPVSLKIKYQATFDGNGKFISGTCKITPLCFTSTDPDRDDLATTVVKEKGSFRTVPMTEAKKNKACTQLFSFKCEGSPWYPKDRDNLVDGSKIEGTFDLTNSKFNIPTCGHTNKSDGSRSNFMIRGDLASESDKCMP